MRRVPRADTGESACLPPPRSRPGQGGRPHTQLRWAVGNLGSHAVSRSVENFAPLSPVFWQGKVQSAESGPAQERRRHQRSAFLTTKSLYPTRIYRQDVSHHARTNDHATTRCTKQNASSTIASFHSNSHRKDGTVALHGASWRFAPDNRWIACTPQPSEY